jgi:hypothetical protein
MPNNDRVDVVIKCKQNADGCVPTIQAGRLSYADVDTISWSAKKQMGTVTIKFDITDPPPLADKDGQSIVNPLVLNGGNNYKSVDYHPYKDPGNSPAYTYTIDCSDCTKIGGGDDPQVIIDP